MKNVPFSIAFLSVHVNYRWKHKSQDTSRGEQIPGRALSRCLRDGIIDNGRFDVVEDRENMRDKLGLGERSIDGVSRTQRLNEREAAWGCGCDDG